MKREDGRLRSHINKPGCVVINEECRKSVGALEEEQGGVVPTRLLRSEARRMRMNEGVNQTKWVLRMLMARIGSPI